MSDDQLASLLELYRALWPAAPLPATDAELRVWHQILGDTDPREVVAALETLAADGERFAPPVGLIFNRVTQLRVEVPLWVEVASDLLAIHGRGTRSSSPLVRHWANRLTALDTANTIGRSSEDDWPTVSAQWRHAWEAIVARDLRDRLYAGVRGDSPRITAARQRIEEGHGRDSG